MKSTKLSLAIFLTILPFGFGIINSNEFSEASDEELSQKMESSPKCNSLKAFSILHGKESEDFLVVLHKQAKDLIMECQNDEPENELAAKQLALVNAWIEMPEKLNKTEEEKNNLKMAFDFMTAEHNNLTVALVEKAEEHHKLTIEFGQIQEEKKTWKVLAIVFIGVATALLLFIVAACAFFYQLGRKEI